GVLGGALAHLLLEAVGSLGTWVLAAVSGLAGVVLVLGEPPSRIAARLRQAMQRGQRRPAAVAERGAQEERAVPAAPEFPNHLLEVPIAGPAEPLPAAAAAQETEAGQDLAPAASGHPLRRADTEYRRPGLELLDPPAPERAVNPQEIKERIRVLENTFAQFGIKVAVNQVSCGPSVTRYELQPAPGVKVSRIISLADDLQLSLAAQGIRIEAPIPGKAAIGVEVPNQRTALVSLRGLLQQPAFQGHESPLAVALGEDISGSPLVLNLADMPHLLIAGATGSGKSVCLNTIILSLLYGASPDELRLLLIDPKMVELAVYNGIPHLLVPVVTDARKAATALRWMVSEMEQRYQKFSEAGVRDIYRYHEAGLEALPFIVVVIDELADLMLVAPVEVEDAICRLAQMARAAGIHLVVATQRPSVDVVTGIIKANIPSRIAFAVSSQADSRTILDAGGAEKLLGRGDMLVQPVGAAKPLRVQGAFVSDAEIARVVDFIRGQGLETADESALPLDCEPEMEGGEFGDPLFWEAARVCVAHDRASVSLLQRKLRIGYSRAARLVDMLEERGLVSAPDVTRKREVLVDAMQLERLCRDNNMC
ncbi:MAG: DNA translocase FtsK, partial [Syntrophomonadaceae bacterium]|nr:DNA translocase FtsK [Syntrophomonadaceae bacterium]